MLFLSLKVVSILSYSENPDEMQHSAAFHLRLHCLPKYPFMVFPVYKGLSDYYLLRLCCVLNPFMLYRIFHLYQVLVYSSL